VLNVEQLNIEQLNIEHRTPNIERRTPNIEVLNIEAKYLLEK